MPSARSSDTFQVRMGPNRVGWQGLLQPIADAAKLAFKEIIIPSGADKMLFIMAPVLSMGAAIAAWAVVPFNDGWVLADVNAGLLYILAMTSLGVYGVIIAGWASNSKYALLGALRSAAQIVAYEIAMGFALVVVLMAAGSLNLSDIVNAQEGNVFNWFWLPLFPMFVVYVIAGVAETNRSPFDVAEGESEIVAGFHVDYSGMPFSVFFIAEYANMVLICVLSTVMFLGGWLSPVPELADVAWLGGSFWASGFHWFVFKVAFFMFVFSVAARDFPALSLRSDHAPRLEGLHPAHHRLDRGRGDRDHGGASALVSTRYDGHEQSPPVSEEPVASRVTEGAVTHLAIPVPAEVYDSLSGGENAPVPSLPRSARAQALSQW